MKKQFLTFALSIAILLGGAIPAYALDNNMVGTHTITRASQYLDGYSVGIEARGNGKIAVAMTVDGTGIMEKMECGDTTTHCLLRNIPSFTNITRETLWERPTFKELQVSAIV